MKLETYQIDLKLTFLNNYLLYIKLKIWMDWCKIVDEQSNLTLT